MLILIFGSKVVLGTISNNMTQKPLFYAAPKVLGDQKLLERVCYMLELKVTKFQLLRRERFKNDLEAMTEKTDVSPSKHATFPSE